MQHLIFSAMLLLQLLMLLDMLIWVQVTLLCNIIACSWGCLLSHQLVPLLASRVRRRTMPLVPAGAALDPCTALTGMPKAFSSAATAGSSFSGGILTPFSAEVVGAGWALRCCTACLIHPGASGNFGARFETACRAAGACEEAAETTA